MAKKEFDDFLAAKQYFALGKECYESNNFADAVEHFTRARQLDPELSDLDHYMGLSLASLSENQEAIPYLRTAIANNPADTAAYLNLAKLYGKAGAHGSALELLENAAQQNPTNADIHFQLALLYFTDERLDKSMTHLEAVLQVEPSHWGALVQLGYAYYCFRCYAKAIECFEQATKINSDDWNLLICYSSALSLTQQTERRNLVLSKLMTLEHEWRIPEEHQHLPAINMLDTHRHLLF